MLAFKAGTVDVNLVIFGFYKIISSVGVEAFMLLSGFGLFFSMSRGGELKDFYKKRFRRLVLHYIPVGIMLWGIWDFVINEGGWKDFFMDFTFLSFWTEGEIGIWFIGIMILLYLAFPLIYRLIVSDRGLIKAFAVSVLIYAAAFLLWKLFPVVFDNVEIGILRIPCFIYGSMFACMVKRGTVVSPAAAAGAVALGFVLKALDTLLDPAIFFTRITGCVYGIGLIILFCALIDRRPLRRVCAFLRKTGEYSLELYMIHVAIRKAVKGLGYPTYDPPVYMCIIAASVVLSFVLHFFVRNRR